MNPKKVDLADWVYWELNGFSLLYHRDYPLYMKRFARTYWGDWIEI